MVALLRVNTLFQIIFSSPLRWLAGCSGELDDWSIVSLGESLDSVETALISIAEDGHSLLDPSLDPFAGIALKQPKFATWRKERAERRRSAHGWRKRRRQDTACMCRGGSLGGPLASRQGQRAGD